MRISDKALKGLLVVLIVALAVNVAVYALVTSLSFHQSLGPVPKAQGFVIYQKNGITEIPSDIVSDQTAIWEDWDSTNTCYWALIKVKNVGNSQIDVVLSTSGLNVGWEFTYTPSVAIDPDTTRDITLYVTNPSATAGDFTGDFTITVSIM